MQVKLKHKPLDAQRTKKRCWNKIGSPLLEGSKNAQFRLRSNSNIVIAAAKTGNDKTNKKHCNKYSSNKKRDIIIIITLSCKY